MRNDDEELARLRARIEALETERAERAASDELRELEYRSLVHDVAVKAAYIDKLERAYEEVVGPKDVHIRNLEAIIAQLSAGQQSPADEQRAPAGSLGRIARRLRG